jgi:poly-gamma-glutamate capsule biosynthesis protein CapA/YwtB (metallophosphatase superfamily)
VTRGEFSVFLAGDVFLGEHLKDYIKKNGPAYPFAGLRETIDRHDIAFANFESSITTAEKPIWVKKYVFQVGLDEARALGSSGLDLVSIANNHTMDFGEEGFLDTLEALETIGQRYVGGGRDLAEATQPSVFTAGGTRVVFLAYSDWSSILTRAADGRAGINPLETDRAVEEIRMLKKPGSVVIVSVHWGLQHTETPTAQQVRAAHALVDAGADVIAGHHPHCPQSVEVYKGKPVFYSLGNLVFGLSNPDRVHNIAASLLFDGDRLVSARILPVNGLFFSNGYSPSFLEGDEAAAVVKKIEKISRRFHTKVTLTSGRALLDLQGMP